MTGILIFVLGFVALLFVTQDVQVFPGALMSIFSGTKRNPKSLPQDVESIFVETQDGKRLEIWRLPPAFDAEPRPYTAIIFHGNGGTVQDFFALQLWFHYLGITSYGFDYRGFGKSSGWPSEQGLHRDSDAVYEYVTRREQATMESLIILGISVGGAPAARIASIHQPRLLVLLSAFTDVKSAARGIPVIGLLAPLLWYRLPTIEYVRALKNTALLLAHGERDRTIDPGHRKLIEQAYNGSGGLRSITAPNADHNDLFFRIREELAREMLALLGTTLTANR